MRVMFKFILIFIVFLICASFSFPQVNTEKFRKENEEEGISGKVSLAAGFASGNSEFVNVKSAARIDYSIKNFDLFLVGNYEFQEAKDEKVVNKGFAHLRSIITLTPTLSLEFFFQKEFNQFILLEDRNLAGSGLRLDVINLFSAVEDSLVEIYWGSGLMFENERYNISVSPKTNLFRSTNYFTIKWQITNNFSFTTINYFQLDIKRLHDYRILSDAGFNFLITEDLVFNSSLSWRYDNEPVEGVKRYDVELSNGITFSF
jgi:putative salt-induced outer membrane protein YdiY